MRPVPPTLERIPVGAIFLFLTPVSHWQSVLLIKNPKEAEAPASSFRFRQGDPGLVIDFKPNAWYEKPREIHPDLIPRSSDSPEVSSQKLGILGVFRHQELPGPRPIQKLLERRVIRIDPGAIGQGAKEALQLWAKHFKLDLPPVAKII